MIILIPSYHRAGNVKTFDLLAGAFSKEEVILGTQTQEEYEAYSKFYGEKATVILGEANCCAGNRNNLIDYAQKKGEKEVLFCDDDLRYIRTLDDDKLRGDDFRILMERCFDKCRKNDVVMFGGYITDNRLQMKRTAKRNIIVGALMGLLDTSLRFDSGFKVKDDYELSLRLMTHGRKVVRFDSFAPATVPRAKGGCEDERKKGTEYVVADLLCQAYPTLVKPHPKRKGEIKFIG
jgi:hypothetical protein